MKLIKTSLLAATAAGLFLAPCCTAALTAKSSAVDSVSYAFGINIGYSLGQMNVQGVDPSLLAKGISDAIKASSDSTLKVLSNEQSIAIIQAYLTKIPKEEGAAFLAKNKTEKDVITTESGLQYKVLTEGSGLKPTAEDTVEVHYKGTLLNGKEFDSSYQRGEPITFPVSGVIKGWTEGLQLLNEGSKAIFWIPSDLAYGEYGGGPIGPNATLIFELELIKVKPKQ
ncbi:MAG: FKBP-type peptidyl-prolyl cis-trans isomerase [Prevotellaceae bacterium]|nr:FKBP-type peptidyl-prolyl cis-trans isomerase [Prevotellaceae bacterium]